MNMKTLLLTAALALGLSAAPASAVPIINTTVDQSLGDCSVTCSLRDAVALSVSGDTLHVPAGHYVLSLGDIVVGKSLTIVGDGARSTILDGNGASRIFNNFNFGTFELDNLSLINGLATTPVPLLGTISGGALAGGGKLTLRRCRIAGSQAEQGGGILWLDNLTIDQCTIEGNSATSQIFGHAGGGIFAVSSFATITNSTLTGNTAPAGRGGAVTLFDALITLVNVTVTANQASVGGGIDLSFANGNLVNTIIAGNSGGDCYILVGRHG